MQVLNNPFILFLVAFPHTQSVLFSHILPSLQQGGLHQGHLPFLDLPRSHLGGIYQFC